MTTADNLKFIRHHPKIGLSYRKMAAAVGIAPNSWQNYEKGICLPKIPVARRIIAYARSRGVEVNFEFIYPSESDSE